MSDANRPSPSVPDIESLDAGWEDEDLDEEEDEEEDLEALDSGWDTAKRRKTAAEKAARRKDLARRKAEKRKARAAEIAQKQKKKKARSKDANGASIAPSAGEGAAPVDESTNGEGEPKRESKPRVRRATALPARSLRRDWTRMALIVGAIVAVAAIAFYLLGKR
jgi:cobalamin biosynthesis Mg chelatase CobN